jgi:EAL domain-containing protein (putative c-di-GMP-specific phosphodiesterase class I)
VAEALGDAGLPPSALVLEITESAALEESACVTSVFTRLRASGVRIAVDDFGSGYSSLAYLIRMPADVLKIDRTLLDFVTTRDGSLVKGVAELGRTLGLVVVVEGVETPDHLARAREAACDAAQGFHFARPLPAAAVADYLRGWAAPHPAGRGAAARST